MKIPLCLNDSSRSVSVCLPACRPRRRFMAAFISSIYSAPIKEQRRGRGEGEGGGDGPCLPAVYAAVVGHSLLFTHHRNAVCPN